MKLLLIEDEDDIAQFIVRGFKADGCVVTHAENTEEALNLMSSSSFDAVILDLILPTMSGEDLLKKMRAEKNNVPVIVLTSVSSAEMKTRLLNAGADDYLVKPFAFIELLARIRCVLRRCKGYAQQCEDLTVADLRLSLGTRLVTRQDRPIRLRLREYVLLEYFLRHPDEVISRNTLIENIWDYNVHIFSNTVDSHISLLRKKINQGFDVRLIDTVHGVGYVLRSKNML